MCLSSGIVVQQCVSRAAVLLGGQNALLLASVSPPPVPFEVFLDPRVYVEWLTLYSLQILCLLTLNSLMKLWH